jgi:hypothetical protein
MATCSWRKLLNAMTMMNIRKSEFKDPSVLVGKEKQDLITMKQKDYLPQAYLPRSIYHLADAANWSSIQQYGLLSTSALLDLLRVQGKEREQIEQQHRAQQVRLANGVIIRDQKPMPPTMLGRCLYGVTPREWYALLNARVFFWFDIERLNRMLKANYERPQIVIVLDTERLLRAYAEQVALTPINTGNARRRPALRGRQTFVPYSTWLETGWASEAEALGTRMRPRNHRPAELSIPGAVPDVMNFIRGTKLLNRGELFS